MPQDRVSIAFSILLPQIPNFGKIPRSSTFQKWAGVGLVVPEMAYKDVLWGLNVPSRTVEPIKLVGGSSREETSVAKLTASSYHRVKKQCPAFRLWERGW